MSIEPDETRSRSDLAATLKQLRNAAGLSGERLAARCAMSQTKISRIETGRALPTVVDVERILNALAAPPGAAQELIALARKANVEHTSLRSIAEMGLWRKQAELKALTESCRVQRQFMPALPSGLLQVPDYARSTLTPDVPSSPKGDVERAVQARMERQAALNDPDREFVFVLTEQAVRWRCTSRETMARQCDHMAKLARRRNITIDIIPLSAEVRSAPMNTFTIYDDRMVTIELLSGDVAVYDYRDIVYYLEIFELFRLPALTGQRAESFLLTARDEFM